MKIMFVHYFKKIYNWAPAPFYITWYHI
jgi:hypothetical protein